MPDENVATFFAERRLHVEAPRYRARGDVGGNSCPEIPDFVSNVMQLAEGVTLQRGARQHSLLRLYRNVEAQVTEQSDVFCKGGPHE